MVAAAAALLQGNALTLDGCPSLVSGFVAALLALVESGAHAQTSCGAGTQIVWCFVVTLQAARNNQLWLFAISHSQQAAQSRPAYGRALVVHVSVAGLALQQYAVHAGRHDCAQWAGALRQLAMP
ncbi:hypothetical protein COO60DRAFT_1518382 [Scenedesmus sp. NREL 46B-D3]|nr:hypothetical protein COO60DRAFT_1518382 [Scenedesmus sp. NREL 46B-D3]